MLLWQEDVRHECRSRHHRGSQGEDDVHITSAQFVAEVAKQPHALSAGQIVLGPQVNQRGAHRDPALQREIVVVHHPLHPPIAIENKGTGCGAFQLVCQLVR